jgi:hypothetical protein
MYHGLDGALAVRALGMLEAIESVPVLEEAFLRVDPHLARVANPMFSQNPLSWTDFRTKMYVLPALGDLKTASGKRFLHRYLAMDTAQAREIAPLQYEEATRALFQHDLNAGEIEALLRSPQAAVRGTAVLECLDRPSKSRTAALKAAAPWALELPRSRR